MIKKYIFMALGPKFSLAYIGSQRNLPIFLVFLFIVLQSQTRRWNVGYTTHPVWPVIPQTGHRKECSHKGQIRNGICDVNYILASLVSLAI